MYDSLLLFAPVDDPARLVSTLEDVEERYSHRTGATVIAGRCGNLLIRTSGSGITVSGSLSRYWLGTNFMAPTFSDCKEALHRLEEELGSSLASMPVYRIDVAATLNLKHPCSRYLKLFGHLPRYIRLERNGGLLYRTRRRELDFYDKKAEAHRRREAPPTCFNGRHALRYELRFRQQLRGEFGEKVTARRLIEPDFYRMIVERWEQGYQRIYKQDRTALAQLDMSSPKHFGASLERIGVEILGGEIAVLQELRMRRDAGEIDRLTYSRLQARVSKLCRTDGKEQREEAIEELDLGTHLELERQISM